MEPMGTNEAEPVVPEPNHLVVDERKIEALDPSPIAFDEWNRLEPAIQTKKIRIINECINTHLVVLRAQAQGLSKQSIRAALSRNIFKILLILTTSITALLGLAAQTFGSDVKQFSFWSSIFAIAATTVGTLDGFFAYGEKRSLFLQAFYEHEAIAQKAETYWQAYVKEQTDDYHTYQNALKCTRFLVENRVRLLELSARVGKKMIEASKDTKSTDSDAPG